MQVPDGTYAVPDPDDPDRLTLWTVVGGKLRDWPPGTRWRPVPPPAPAGLGGEERRAWRQDWYDSTYFPWKAAVLQAIAADPAGAAAAFVERAGHVELPAPTRRPAVRATSVRSAPASTASQRRRSERDVMAAALRLAGRSYGQIGGILGIPKTTAYRGSAAGRGCLDGSDAVVYALTLLRADALIEQLLVARAGASGAQADRIGRWIEDLRKVELAVRERITSGRWPTVEGGGE